MDNYCHHTSQAHDRSENAAMSMPLRINSAYSQYRFPAELSTDPQQHSDGVPWLYGEIGVPAAVHLNVILRLHNRAGIPVIEGRTVVERGQRQLIFRDLHAIGIEAYAHAPEEQRVQIARRIWSRCVYGILALH
jgi:hypothetical protein